MGHVLMARPVHHDKAPIDKWDINILVMYSSLVSTGWGHHTITQKTQVGVVADHVL